MHAFDALRGRLVQDVLQHKPWQPWGLVIRDQ